MVERSTGWSPDELVGHHEFTVPNDIGSIANCRRIIGEFVDRLGGDGELVDTLRIVVSELASNVVRHATVDTFTVTVRATPGELYLDVSGAGGAPSLDQLASPPPSQESGRGLLIVQSLASEMVAVGNGDDALIRCQFLRPNGT